MLMQYPRQVSLADWSPQRIPPAGMHLVPDSLPRLRHRSSSLPSAERPHGPRYHQPRGKARRCTANPQLHLQPSCPASSEESRAAQGRGERGCECGGLSHQHARGNRCLEHNPGVPRCCQPGNHAALYQHTSLSDPGGEQSLRVEADGVSPSKTGV